MAINYAIKYAEKVAERFHLNSITDDDCGKEYSFLGPGSRTIRISSVDTVPETQYKRTGDNRFGDTHDVGDTLQEMTCTQAPAFSFTIDKLDGTDQAIQKSAGKALRRQLDEVTIPGIDAYRIKKWAMGANILVPSASAPTEDTIVPLIFKTNTAMNNAKVPTDSRTIYIGNTAYEALLLAKPVLGNEVMSGKSLKNGTVAMLAGMKLKPVPDDYMPNGVWFFIKRKGSTVDPVKLAQYDVLPKVKGFSGPVVQGVTYHDAFVLGAKGDGIAMCGNSEVIMKAPTVSVSGGTATCTLSGATELWYTVDGSNPRYSFTKKTVSSGGTATVTRDQKIRVVGVKIAGDDVTAVSPETVKPYA